MDKGQGARIPAPSWIRQWIGSQIEEVSEVKVIAFVKRIDFKIFFLIRTKIYPQSWKAKATECKLN